MFNCTKHRTSILKEKRNPVQHTQQLTIDVLFKAETFCHCFLLSLCLFYLLPTSGSMNQFIAVYNANGDVISNIKYYDGFMGQRIGAISCLAFHPYWVK